VALKNEVGGEAALSSLVLYVTYLFIFESRSSVQFFDGYCFGPTRIQDADYFVFVRRFDSFDVHSHLQNSWAQFIKKCWRLHPTKGSVFPMSEFVPLDVTHPVPILFEPRSIRVLSGKRLRKDFSQRSCIWDSCHAFARITAGW
jgi:hypothetical protein